MDNTTVTWTVTVIFKIKQCSLEFFEKHCRAVTFSISFTAICYGKYEGKCDGKSKDPGDASQKL